MQASRFINTIQNLFRKAINSKAYQEKSFQTLPIPWRIAQLEDEEDPKVP